MKRKEPKSVVVFCVAALLLATSPVFASDGEQPSVDPVPAHDERPVSSPPVIEEGAQAQVVVHVAACRLELLSVKPGEEPRVVKEYVVSTAKKGVQSPMGEGHIERIERFPWWYPTKETREYMARRGVELPDRVPPNHPRNYMGSCKMVLSHTTSKGALYRIHGVPEGVGTGSRASGGCVRMRNVDVLELADVLRPGTKVIFLP